MALLKCICALHVNRRMARFAQGHRVIIAAARAYGLEVMRMRWTPGTDTAWMRTHEIQIFLVRVSCWFGEFSQYSL